MIKVYDNLFTDDFLMNCQITSMGLPWGFNNVANRSSFPFDSRLSKGSHRIFGARLFEKTGRYRIRNDAPDIFFDVLDHFIFDVIKDPSLDLISIDCNLQVMGQEGTIHKDSYIGSGRDRTLLFFPHYKWEKEWGGQFETFDENNNLLNEYYPEPGRLIFIDSSVPHRGTAPIEPNIGRFSIAFRLDTG